MRRTVLFLMTLCWSQMVWGPIVEAHPGCGFAKHVEGWRKAPLKQTSVRPPAAYEKTSSHWPIRIHWQEGVTEAYADEILLYTEESWRRLFTEMGFLAPHPDGEIGGDAYFDVYIVTDLDPLIGGYASFSGFFEETERADAFGYLVINNNIDIRVRRFVVAHELFHTSQMAYDWWEDISFMEGSATWIVDHVFDDEDIYWRYYEFFNKQPYLASDYISLANPYQYGSGLWLQYLDEAHGASDGRFIREIWEGTVQNGFDNEPDFLDVIEQKTQAKGGLTEAWREFGEWRVLLGSREDGGHFAEGAVWDSRMDPYFEAQATPGTTRIEGATAEGLGPYSHAYLGWRRSGLAADRYELAIEQDDPTRTLLVDVLWRNGTETVKESLGAVLGTTALQVSGVSPGAFTEAVFVISDVTDGAYDADTSPWDQKPFRYQISLQPQ